jgi:hypothetical protein
VLMILLLVPLIRRAIAKTEGVGALWRGIGPTLVGVIPARYVHAFLLSFSLHGKLNALLLFAL